LPQVIAVAGHSAPNANKVTLSHRCSQLIGLLAAEIRSIPSERIYIHFGCLTCLLLKKHVLMFLTLKHMLPNHAVWTSIS